MALEDKRVRKIVTHKFDCLNTLIELYPKIYNFALSELNIVLEHCMEIDNEIYTILLEYKITLQNPNETQYCKMSIGEYPSYNEIWRKYKDSNNHCSLEIIARSLFKNKKWVLENTELFESDYKPSEYDLDDNDKEYFCSAIEKYNLKINSDAIQKNARLFWDSNSFYLFLPSTWFGNPKFIKNSDFSLIVQWQNMFYKDGYFIFWSVINEYYMIEFLAKEHAISSLLYEKPDMESENIKVPHHMKIVIYAEDIVAERNIILLPEITSKLEKLIRYQIKSETTSDYDMSFVTIFGEGDQWDNHDDIQYARYTPYEMNGTMILEIDNTDIARLDKMYGEIKDENNEEVE